MARLIYFCFKIRLLHTDTDTLTHTLTYQHVAEVVMLEAFGHHAIPW